MGHFSNGVAPFYTDGKIGILKINNFIPDQLYGEGGVTGEDLICLKRYLLDWDEYMDEQDPGYKGPGGKR